MEAARCEEGFIGPPDTAIDINDVRFSHLAYIDVCNAHVRFGQRPSKMLYTESGCMTQSVVWRDVTINFNRKMITGKYASSDWMITVKLQLGDRSTKLTGANPISLAASLLRELAARIYQDKNCA